MPKPLPSSAFASHENKQLPDDLPLSFLLSDLDDTLPVSKKTPTAFRPQSAASERRRSSEKSSMGSIESLYKSALSTLNKAKVPATTRSKRESATKDPEAVYQELQNLKSTVNDLDKQKRVLNGKIRHLQEENSRLEKRVEDAIQTTSMLGSSTGTAGSRGSGDQGLVLHLKRLIREQLAAIQKQNEEIAQLKVSIRHTKVLEHESEVKVYLQENLRLKRLLEHKLVGATIDEPEEKINATRTLGAIKEKHDALRNENEKLRDLLKNLRSINESHETNATDLQTQLNNVQTEIADLESQKQKLTSKCDSLASKLEESEKNAREMAKRFEAQTHEIARLREGSEKQNKSLHSAIEQRDSQLAAVNKELDSWVQKYEEKSQEATRWETRCAQVEAEGKVAKTELEAVRKEAQSSAKDTLHKVKELEMELSRTKNDLTSAREQSQALKATETELGGLKRNLATLQSKYDEKESELSRYQNEIDDSKSTIHSLKAQLDSAKQTHQKEMDDLNLNHAHAIESLKKKSAAEMEDLKISLTKDSPDVGQIEALKQELGQVREKLSKAEEASYREKDPSATTTLENLVGEKQKQVEEGEKNIAKLARDNGYLQQKVDALEERIHTLEQSLDEAGAGQKELAPYVERIYQLEDIIKQYQQQYRELEDRLEQSQAATAPTPKNLPEESEEPTTVEEEEDLISYEDESEESLSSMEEF